MRASRWNLLAIAVAGVFILAACGPAAEPTPTPDPGATPDPAATPPPDDETGFADTIRRVLDGQPRMFGNATTDVPSGRVSDMVFDALYQYNEAIEPIPQLADGECDISEDETVWTCTIIDNAFFHNGEPITAEDIAFNFQLAASPNCTYNPDLCFGAVFEEPVEIEAIDDRTVEFTLPEPYAPFLTVSLPSVLAEPRAVIEEQAQELIGAAEGIDPAEIEAAQEQLDEATGAEEPDQAACEEALGDAESLLQDADVELPDRADFEGEEGFDACAYATELSTLLSSLAGAIGAEGIDAIASVYNLLPYVREPVGSGPFQFESLQVGESVTLSAFEDYHAGAPETQTFEFVIITDIGIAAQALVAGDVDWVDDLTPDARAVIEGQDVKIAEFNQFGHLELQYNMHEAIPLPDGTEWQGYFYDRALRLAMQHCIDKEELVLVATDGAGVPIEGPIPPASWAFDPDLRPVERDVERARQFIEEEATVHTWTEGDDGIYVNQDGDRLSSLVLVRAGQQSRIDFMNLLADQVRDCGIEIEVEPADFASVLLPALEWPHIPAGHPEPWHAYFGGWGGGVDPDQFSLFHSSQCNSEENPFTFNYVCYQSEEADQYIEAGLATSDLDERAEAYREMQRVLQEDQPYLFAWADIAIDAMHPNMDYHDGGLDDELDSEFWGWERHKLVIREE